VRKNQIEFLYEILDYAASGVTHNLSVIAKRMGMSPTTIFMWIKDKNIVLPEFMGRQGVTFGQAMQMARNVTKNVTIARTLEDYVAHGRVVDVWHHGVRQYRDDEFAMRLSEAEFADALEMGLVCEDKKLRDANGNRIPETRIEHAPAQLIEKYASANMAHVYGTKTEVTMKGHVSLGTTVIGKLPPIPVEVQARIDEAREKGNKLTLPTGHEYVEETKLIEAQPVEVFEPVAPKRPVPPSWQAELDRLAARQAKEKSDE
jgi:hypothetical protein